MYIAHRLVGQWPKVCNFLFRASPSSRDLYPIFERKALRPSPRQLEKISNIRDAMMRMGQTTLLAVKVLDAKIDNESLDGRSEATETHKVLEQVQNLSLEISEELDAYQELYSNS